MQLDVLLQKTIYLSIAQTSLDPGFTTSAVNVSTGCSNDSLIFIANDSSSNSINWYINNSILIGTSNTISTTLSTYISNNTSVNVSLTLLDTIVDLVQLEEVLTQAI